MTLAYWPARFGESARLTPVGPWQIAHCCASVAPRQIDAASAPRSVLEENTAGETLKSGSTGFALDGALATPAALQIAFQTPPKSTLGCASGRTTNPTIAVVRRIATISATLRKTHGSAKERRFSLLIAAFPRRRPARRRPGGRGAEGSDSRSW